MSRTVLLDMAEGEVIAKCLAAKVNVSTIERLPAGGVRLVCSSVHGAEKVRRSLKKHVIDGPVIRQRHRPATPMW
jgi:hypothetical protein